MMKTFISVLIVVCLTTAVDMAPLKTTTSTSTRTPSPNNRMAIEKRASTSPISPTVAIKKRERIYSNSSSSTTVTESMKRI